MARIRIAQYGTKHGHADGKLLAMRHNLRVELVCVLRAGSRSMPPFGTKIQERYLSCHSPSL